ncbi:hypothetical protein LJR289_001770 [Pseudoduganella sp. LjRoot289]|uniref:hypothetical protein n=1 Tax=Pseudoduganella sp. LjRoot289 TaxID=3342314 RepID=UPI003ED11175
MNVRISDHPFRLELSVFRASGGAGSVQHANANDVYRYLKASNGRASAPDDLRELLGRNSTRALRSDEDLWREAAAQVMMGQLFLIQQQTRSQAGGAAVDAAEGPVAERPKRPGVSPPPPLPPPRKPAVTEAPQPEPELTALLEQDVQAAALEQAAENGTPFCEVCEKAKAARAQADADAQAGRNADTKSNAELGAKPDSGTAA